VSLPGLRRMAAMNGTAIPPDLDARLDTARDEDVAAIGAETALALSEELLRRGAPGLHLYTLNRSAALRSVWAGLDRVTASPPRA
jgi:methylenetetrahydrofolate reductase (NADPH)